MVGPLFSCSIRPLASALRRMIPAALILLSLAAGGAAQAAAPDLVATGLSFTPAKVNLGALPDWSGRKQYVYVTVTVTNKGTAPANPSILRVWASRDASLTGTGDDYALMNIPVPALAVGASVNYKYVSATNDSRLRVDLNEIEVTAKTPLGKNYLPDNVYILGVETDAGQDNAEGAGTPEANNFLKAGGTLTVGMIWPPAPTGQQIFAPAPGTVGVNIDRFLSWTSTPYATRFDLYLSRLKDVRQDFQPHAEITPPPNSSKILLTSFFYPVTVTTGTYYRNLYDITDRTARDILITNGNKISLCAGISPAPAGAKYEAARDIFQASATYDPTRIPIGSGSTYSGMKYAFDTVTAVNACLLNWRWYNDSNGRPTMVDRYTDLVAANYMEEFPAKGLDDDEKNYGWYRGRVWVLINHTSVTAAMPFTKDTLAFTSQALPNKRKDEGAVYPMGIKSLVTADFDNDSDLDVMAGSDRLWRQDVNNTPCDKVVVWQSDWRNTPQDKDTKAPLAWEGFTTKTINFKPNNFTGLNRAVDDCQDMAVGDFDGDNRIDVAIASFHGDKLIVLHNETDVSGDDRSTRTLKFTDSLPLPTNTNNDGRTTTSFMGACSVVTADFDNDRKADVVGAAYFEGKVVVFENRSTAGADSSWNPQFIPHVLADDPKYPSALGNKLTDVEKVSTGDINGDGKIDVIAASAADDTLYWFENMGNFQFKPHEVGNLVPNTTDRISQTAVADVDEDGFLDIVGYSRLNSKIYWYGDQPAVDTLQPVATDLSKAWYQPGRPFDYETTYLWQVVSKAGENYKTATPPMAFRAQHTRLKVTPTLTPQTLIEPSQGFRLSLNCVVDGYYPVNDLTFAIYADPVLDRPFLGVLNMRDWFSFSKSIRIVGQYYMGTQAHYPYRPGSPWQIEQPFNIPIAFTKTDPALLPEGLYNIYVVPNPLAPIMQDGVADGVYDGVVDGFQNINGTNWYARLNPDGDEGYLALNQLAVAYKPGVPTNPVPADNASSVATTSKLAWSACNWATNYDVLLAKATTLAPDYTSCTLPRQLPGTISMDVGDINGDGLNDVVCSNATNSTTGNVTWFKNTSNGLAFQAVDPALTCPKGAANDISIVKLNSDTNADILACNAADGSIFWYRGIGNAYSDGRYLFNSAQTLIPNATIKEKATGVQTVRAGDLDFDGDMDLVAAASDPNYRLCWFTNNGQGYFDHRYAISTSDDGTPVYAILADVDSDGDLDIVVSFNRPSVVWYENTWGSGSSKFIRHAIPSTLTNPRWLGVADMDNDGDRDIVCVSEADRAVVWFKNDGSYMPNFTQATVATGIAGVRNLALVDYNHDSKMDVVVGGSLGNAGDQLIYLCNNGGTAVSFSKLVISNQASPVTAVCGASVDGDTFPEVIAANGQGAVTWFDYVMNFSFNNPLALAATLPAASTLYSPGLLDPSQGYRWQIQAKRVIPLVGGGTYERVTSSSLWTFFTSQSDLQWYGLLVDKASVRQGGKFTVTFGEKNVGQSDSAPHWTEIWATKDPVLTRGGDDIYLGKVYVTSIIAGGERWPKMVVDTTKTGLQQNLTLPLGFYHIGIYINAGNADNSESSKANNVFVNPGMIEIQKPMAAQDWKSYK